MFDFVRLALYYYGGLACGWGTLGSIVAMCGGAYVEAMAVLNWLEPGGHCSCLAKNETLEARVAWFNRACEEIAEEDVVSVSAAVHGVGRVLAWPLGRPYLRLPGDLFYFRAIDHRLWLRPQQCPMGERLAPYARRGCPGPAAS